MLVVFLLLFTIVGYATITIAGAMLLGGARFLARGLKSTTKHQWLHLLGALVLLPPPLYLYYLVDPTPIDNVADGFRLSRACRRYTEIELPDTPVQSRGVELMTNTTSHRIADQEIGDLALNPFLYLGSKGVLSGS